VPRWTNDDKAHVVPKQVARRLESYQLLPGPANPAVSAGEDKENRWFSSQQQAAVLHQRL
jgi:hypothetical protein